MELEAVAGVPSDLGNTFTGCAQCSHRVAGIQPEHTPLVRLVRAEHTPLVRLVRPEHTLLVRPEHTPLVRLVRQEHTPLVRTCETRTHTTS